MKPKNPTAFIDADVILHRAVSFVGREFDGEPMNDWKLALHYFDHILKNWLKEAGKVKDYYLVLSVGHNFRKSLFEDYKANRADIEPHPAFDALKAEVMERIDTIWEDGIEADDLIGIRCTEDPKHTLAVSADKDFATVPCNFMVPTSHGRKKPDWHSFSEAEADRNWMVQTMTGDTVDNYDGIPGVGPVKANEIVDHPHLIELAPTERFKRGPRKGQAKPEVWVEGKPCSLWESMVSYARRYGKDEAYMITQARLARILRAGEYDFETKEVKLWTPK